MIIFLKREKNEFCEIFIFSAKLKNTFPEPRRFVVSFGHDQTGNLIFTFPLPYLCKYPPVVDDPVLDDRGATGHHQ